MQNLRNEFSQMFVETFAENFHFCQKITKCHFSEQGNCLKFLSTSFLESKMNKDINYRLRHKETYLFEKFNCKYRINFRKIVNKNICEFSKLTN